MECAAYFGIVSIGFENSNKPDAAKKYEEVRDNALERAAILTEQAGLKAETVGARFNMAVEETSKRIDMNTSNISVLMNDYRDLCQEVMTDPEKRGRYWTERGAKELRASWDNLRSKSALNANPSMPARPTQGFPAMFWTPVHHMLVDHSANRATSLAPAG